ncbi:MAG: restriction endonuclease subunit S [Nitrospirae bacterium]|nr:restriction endonuclease subunit S [Nitrospirota bacterium]
MILVKNGDLLISGINVYKGAVAVYEGEEDIIATIHYSSYEFDRAKIEVEFLKLFLKSPEFLDAIREQVPGGIKTEIKPKHLLPLKVAMPDLDGQREIVNSFSKVETIQDTLTVELTNQLDLVKQLRQAFLREAMQGKLVEQDPMDEPASELLKKIKAEKEKLIKEKKLKKEKEMPPIKEDEIPFEIPENWVWCRLGEICRISSGDGLTSQQMAKDGNIPVYGGNGVNGYHNKFNINKQTVVIGRVGYYCGSVHLTEEKAWVTDNAFIVSYSEENIYRDFLIHLLRWADLGQRQFAGSQPVISGQRVYPKLCPLPPLPEQHRIVAKLDQLMRLCDELEQSIRQSKEQTDMLLQAALREALQPKAKVVKLPALQEVEEKAYFKRAVLAAYIINQSQDDPNFGDTKFEKLLYLIEYHAIKRNFAQNYLQQVAGPFDNKFSYWFWNHIEKQKWFKRQKQGAQFVFKPGALHQKSKNLYNYFSKEELERAETLIRYFKNSNYEKPEIVSTLYAVWSNRILQQQEINDDLLIEDFYKWDENKKRYERSLLEKALHWMRKEGLVPDGWGWVIARQGRR